MRQSIVKNNNGRQVIYTDEPLNLKPVVDFLPPPEDLILKDDTVKITIGLSRKSVDFFKKSARRQGGKYQAMIRKVLDLYAARHHA